MDLLEFAKDAQRIQLIAKKTMGISVKRDENGSVKELSLSLGDFNDESPTYAFLRAGESDLIQKYTEFVIKAVS